MIGDFRPEGARGGGGGGGGGPAAGCEMLVKISPNVFWSCRA